MNKYDSYKDSDIQWVEKIPISWETKKLKFLGTVYGGLTGKKGDDFGDEDNPRNKPYIPYTNIFNNTHISKDHFDYVVLEKDEKQNLVKKNDLFVLMSSENYEDLGKTSILVEDCEELYLNSFCKGFRTTKENINPMFINYQLLGHLHRVLISVEGSGFTRINLRQDKLLNIPILITSLKEQNKIVSYLDHKIYQINNLIKGTEQKAKLLKEKRKSLINELVTRGLNTNVEMTESGIEWIKETPTHWENRKLKSLGIFSKGRGITKKDIIDQGLPCIRCGEIYTTYEHKFSETNSFIDQNLLETTVQGTKGVLLFTGDGESYDEIGKCVVYDGDETINIGGGINVFTPDENQVIPSYLSYVMNSESVIFQKSREGRGEIVVHIYSKQLREIQLGLPPINEQKNITEYLDKETKFIDETVLKEEKKIELLKDYKLSLISEVVTGNKRVVS